MVEENPEDQTIENFLGFSLDRLDNSVQEGLQRLKPELPRLEQTLRNYTIPFGEELDIVIPAGKKVTRPDGTTIGLALKGKVLLGALEGIAEDFAENEDKFESIGTITLKNIDPTLAASEDPYLIEFTLINDDDLEKTFSFVVSLDPMPEGYLETLSEEEIENAVDELAAKAKEKQEKVPNVRMIDPVVAAQITVSVEEAINDDINLPVLLIERDDISMEIEVVEDKKKKGKKQKVIKCKPK